jgi:hypothetical protein
VTKRPCTSRAEWRLLPGKAAQRLSAHYQLGCDYGTPLITIFKENDGNEPIYLCEGHVSEIERSIANGAKARLIANGVRTGLVEAQTTDSSDSAKGEDRAKAAEVAAAKSESAATKSNGSVPPRRAGTGAAAELVRALPPRTVKDPTVRGSIRCLAYGDSAKALVDEAIWNLEAGDYEAYKTALQNGRPAVEAAQAAGGQLAIMVRKTSEYTRTLEALLSQSKSTIDAMEVINKPLEQATLALIGNDRTGDAEKDTAIGQLGAFQESLNRGLGPEITPLQAFKMARALGDRAKWGASSDLPEELKPVYGEVYTNLRGAIIATVPEVLGVFERLTNLYVAKAELENAQQVPLSRSCDTGVTGTKATFDNSCQLNRSMQHTS